MPDGTLPRRRPRIEARPRLARPIDDQTDFAPAPPRLLSPLPDQTDTA